MKKKTAVKRRLKGAFFLKSWMMRLTEKSLCSTPEKESSKLIVVVSLLFFCSFPSFDHSKTIH
jgi:hypothetical protein